MYDWVNGDHYDGEWQQNQKHGEGKWDLHNNETYVGGFRKNSRHGCLAHCLSASLTACLTV